MQDPLAYGGVIRKLWIGEAGKYREHLKRLDAQSRHSRFGGGCPTSSSSTMSRPCSV